MFEDEVAELSIFEVEDSGEAVDGSVEQPGFAGKGIGIFHTVSTF